jgi:hypothetical protein
VPSCTSLVLRGAGRLPPAAVELALALGRLDDDDDDDEDEALSEGGEYDLEGGEYPYDLDGGEFDDDELASDIPSANERSGTPVRHRESLKNFSIPDGELEDDDDARSRSLAYDRPSANERSE